MKRGALFLAGVLTVSAILTACGGQESGGSAGSKDSAAAESTTEGKAKDSGEKVTISLLSWNTDEILGEFIAGFEQENPNIKIDLQYVPPVQQYVDKFSVLAASGQMTDMFYIAAENKQEVISKGVAEDISDMEIFSRIDPATSATYGKDGKIYGYSPDAWIGGIFYNKDLFEQAGIEKEPETWQEFVDCAAKLKAIGVSNFLIEDIESLLETAKIKPMVNQILLHISNTPMELVEYCQKNSIVVEAYSPIAHGEILNQPEITTIAKKYGVTVPQLCIRYTLQLGAISLPKTGNPEHMKSNAQLDFQISAEDMELLKNFKKIKSYGDSGIFPVYGGKM